MNMILTLFEQELQKEKKNWDRKSPSKVWIELRPVKSKIEILANIRGYSIII